MATCGSTSLWCGLLVLAALSCIGMSQSNNSGAQVTPQSPDNCTGYSSSGSCNFPDLAQRIYCLSNGSSVTGFCEAREAVCGHRVPLQKDATFCASSIKDSSTTTSITTSQTSTSTGKTTTRSPFNQRDRTLNQHDHTDDQHDHKDDHRDKDNAATFFHTSFSVMVLCFATVVSLL